MRRQRYTVGAIVRVDLGEGLWTFGQVLHEPVLCFFDAFGHDARDPGALVDRPVLFTLMVMRYAVTSGRWERVGRLPPVLEPPFRFRKRDLMTGRQTVYTETADWYTEEPADGLDLSALEVAAGWEPGHVEDRLRDAYHGRPNKWVESMRW